MENVELLKRSRNQLLSLHKSLVDFERTRYEAFNGKVTSGQFLNVLLEDEGLSWLRRFSTFIVDVDEMFALDDGYSDEMVESHLSKLRKLVTFADEDEDFNSKYQYALQHDPDAAGKHAELKTILAD
ncbi:MAG TPA: hypothetical protein VL327_12970 [Pyrinomonadaceae bacterium]|jgi:hypothetical protein|nr:hypothetical protein [Pyrinomonadaceae bacterium]